MKGFAKRHRVSRIYKIRYLKIDVLLKRAISYSRSVRPRVLEQERHSSQPGGSPDNPPARLSGRTPDIARPGAARSGSSPLQASTPPDLSRLSPWLSSYCKQPISVNAFVVDRSRSLCQAAGRLEIGAFWRQPARIRSKELVPACVAILEQVPERRIADRQAKIGFDLLVFRPPLFQDSLDSLKFS